jgi:hypothetical protein
MRNACSGLCEPAHHSRNVACIHDSGVYHYPIAFTILENPCNSLRQRGKTTTLISEETDCSLKEFLSG